jgi:hypothetical protein
VSVITRSDASLEMLPEAHVVARNIVQARQRKVKGAPTVADIAVAITDVQLNGTMKGVSSLVVTLADPAWRLLDSGFFDTDANSEIDPIDLNFPDGTRYWWRLTQVSPSGADRQIQLTFLVRESVYLLHLMGPKQANRAQVTRAEFIESCARQVKEGPIEFYSLKLDAKQKIAKQDNKPKASSKNDTKGSKNSGLGSGSSKGLTVAGSPMTAAQATVVNTLLSVCTQLNAPQPAVVAMIYAGIWESKLNPNTSNSLGYGGVLSSNYMNVKWSDTVGQATAFLKGGKGYRSAIDLAKTTNNPVQIAVMCEAPSIWPDNAYAKEGGYPGDQAATAEANAIVQGGGGGGGVTSTTTSTVTEAYNFQIKPKELFLDGMNRLAQEVNWELFFDGNRLYFDSEQTLIRQKPAAVIHRDDPIVADWSFDWDTRQICTQMQLVLFDLPLEFPPGEVFVLQGFGPASSGSSATPKLPGRWLIQDSQRAGGDVTTTYTLVQPDLPQMEPAPQTKQVTSTVTSGGGGGNPAPGATWGRLDMGFDGNYDMSKGACAPYDGTVYTPGYPGWPGEGTYFWIKNDDQSGPDYTRAMYFAEGATPSVTNGAKVKAGDKIGNPVAHGGTGAPGNFEIGPANTSNGDCLAKQYGLRSAASRQMVMAFYNWMRSLGAGATNNDSAAGGP